MNKFRAALKIRENVPLAPYTTLGIGGSARFFIRAEAEDHVLDALDYAQVHQRV